jgi:hypothetical protein
VDAKVNEIRYEKALAAAAKGSAGEPKKLFARVDALRARLLGHHTREFARLSARRHRARAARRARLDVEFEEVSDAIQELYVREIEILDRWISEEEVDGDRSSLVERENAVLAELVILSAQLQQAPGGEEPTGAESVPAVGTAGEGSTASESLEPDFALLERTE